MNIKLILNTPDLAIGGKSPKRSVKLNDKDFKGKTVKEIVSEHIFNDIIQGQDDSVTDQAMDLIFNFIQPTGIDDISTWWQKPFEELIAKGTKEVVLDLEFSPEGIAFMEQMM